MNVESPVHRIVVSDADGTRWILLLDSEHSTGCITPLPRDLAGSNRGAGAELSSISFSWQRRS